MLSSEKEALEAVQKEGVTVTRPDKALFKEKVGSVYDSYKDNAQMYSLIKRIQEIDKRLLNPIVII